MGQEQRRKRYDLTGEAGPLAWVVDEGATGINAEAFPAQVELCFSRRSRDSVFRLPMSASSVVLDMLCFRACLLVSRSPFGSRPWIAPMPSHRLGLWDGGLEQPAAILSKALRVVALASAFHLKMAAALAGRDLALAH